MQVQAAPASNTDAPAGLSAADWKQIKTALPAAVINTQEAYLKASNTAEDDNFGTSVAVSGDTVVVGAPGEGVVWSSGAVYVFTRNGNTWSQQAYLKASNFDYYDEFGTSVAISGDTIVVGAIGENDNAAGFSVGAAYVFTRSGSTWSQQAYLKASNAEANDNFGWSVGVSGDTIVVGAIGEASNATGVNGNQADNSAIVSGAAYVFTRTGSAWSQQAYLKASNTEAGDYFGQSVAISGDTVTVGAPYENGRSGAVYVFTRSGSNWSQQAYLKASNAEEDDKFGQSVAISGDTVVVGAIGEASGSGDEADNFSPSSGAAYVFTRSGVTWSQQAYLKDAVIYSDHRGEFGWSVAISGDRLVVGMIGEDSNATYVNGNWWSDSATDSGAAYAFVREGSTWIRQAYLKASNTDSYDRFGNSVAVSGDTIVAGAYSEDSHATGVDGDESDNSAYDSGAAYVISVADTTAPTVDNFAASSPSPSLTVPITALTASDDFGVAGYLITTSSTPPERGADGWSALAPTTYTVGGNGNYTLYAWAKDAVGNVSAGFGFPVVVADNTAPTVTSILCIDANPTVLASVDFTVNFSESVIDVDASDFSLTTTGVSGAAVVGISGSGVTRTISVNTGTGNGTIRLDVVDEDGITDVASNPLGGTGSGNGDFIDGEVYTVMKSADVDVTIGGMPVGSYSVPAQGSMRQSYSNVNSGPVQITSANNDNIIAAERVIYAVNGTPTSFSEMMGRPVCVCSIDTYYFPWYNNVDLDTQFRLGNVGSISTDVTIKVGSTDYGPYPLAAGASTRISLPGVNNGPVTVQSTDGVPIIVAERVIYAVNGLRTSFSEMMGVPVSEADFTYFFPWYNNVDLDTQFRFGNLGPVDTDVTIIVGNTDYGPYTLSAGHSTRISLPGVNSGPVEITSSNTGIIAAERVIYSVNGTATSFSELMGLPMGQMTDTYQFPWYNNVDLDTQLRFGNVEGFSTDVTVTVGNTDYGPYTLAATQSMRISLPGVNSGPVRIHSTGGARIVAAERVIYTVNGLRTSFSELMGLPGNHLSTQYLFPWYNNVDLDTQLRFGNP